MQTAVYSILDLEVTLSAPAAVVAAMDRVYGALRESRPGLSTTRIPVRIEVTEPAPGLLRMACPWGRVEVDAGEAAHLMAFVIQNFVIRYSRAYFVLHAACVAWSGRGAILAAASSTGKTTLCARLVQRGADYLSDELAPVQGDTGRLLGFPRALGLREGSGTLLGLDAAAMGEPLALGDEIKFVVSADQLREGSVVTAATPAAVILLAPPDEEGPDGEETLELSLAVEGDGFEEGLRGLEGVRGVTRVDGRAWPMARVALEPGTRVVAAVDELATRTGTLIASHYRGRSRRIDYSLAPVCEQITPEAGMKRLLPAVLNGRELPGPAAQWIFRLMQRMGGLPFYRVTPGRLEETAELVEGLVR